MFPENLVTDISRWRDWPFIVGHNVLGWRMQCGSSSYLHFWPPNLTSFYLQFGANYPNTVICSLQFLEQSRRRLKNKLLMKIYSWCTCDCGGKWDKFFSKRIQIKYLILKLKGCIFCVWIYMKMANLQFARFSHHRMTQYWRHHLSSPGFPWVLITHWDESELSTVWVSSLIRHQMCLGMRAQGNTH